MTDIIGISKAVEYGELSQILVGVQVGATSLENCYMNLARPYDSILSYVVYNY